MDTSLSSFLSLYQLTTGRALFALQGVAAALAARAEDLSDVRAHVDAACQHLVQTRALETEYERGRHGPRGSSEVGALDLRLDRALVALRDVLQAHAGCDEPEIAARADALLGELFPRGVAAITHATYVDELSLVEELLARLDARAADVGELGLGRFAARVRELSEAYRAALAKPGRPAVAFDQVRAARRRSDELVREVFVMIAGRFPFASDEHAAARAALLGPILRQHEAVGAYLRSRRAVQDVDPTSGEPTPPPASDPAAPTPA